MAQVIKNADSTFTITFTATELKLIARWATEKGRTEPVQLAEVINGFMLNKFNDYRGIDGPTMRLKYEALTPAKQAQVDTLLG